MPLNQMYSIKLNEEVAADLRTKAVLTASNRVQAVSVWVENVNAATTRSAVSCEACRVWY